MLQPGDVVNNKYEIIGLIGRGGMSAVYKVKELTTGIQLAIKDVDRSKESGNQVFEERLTEEGQMLKRLSNTHLPKIYDIIENESSFMLVMDFVEGESLDKLIARTGPQTEAYIYNWGMQICDVFTYLHNQNPPIIYRDMKPANVILQPDGKLMMIDFGTARTQKIGKELSSDTVCIGTEGFAAPEQYGGLGESDARTDIFCLGATLYNMVTGHSPYDYPKGILPLERWDPELADSPLNAIITKCTQRSPLDRYQTAEELRMDLALAESGLLKVGKNNLPISKGWQKQVTKTQAKVTGGLAGLSGLLQHGAKEEKNQPKQPGTQTFEPEPAKATQWQQITLVQTSAEARTQSEIYSTKAIPQTQAPVNEEAAQVQGTSLWRTVLIAAAAVAVIMLLLSVIFAITGAMTGSTVFLIFAIAAVCLVVISFVLMSKERNRGTDEEKNN